MGFEALSPLATQLGIGGVIGFVIGYALKKLFKFILVLIGMFFVLMLYLSYEDFIVINYDRVGARFQALVQGFIQQGGGGLTAPAFLQANIPLAGAFVVGLALGLKVG